METLNYKGSRTPSTRKGDEQAGTVVLNQSTSKSATQEKDHAARNSGALWDLGHGDSGNPHVGPRGPGFQLSHTLYACFPPWSRKVCTTALHLRYLRRIDIEIPDVTRIWIRWTPRLLAACKLGLQVHPTQVLHPQAHPRRVRRPRAPPPRALRPPAPATAPLPTPGKEQSSRCALRSTLLKCLFCWGFAALYCKKEPAVQYMKHSQAIQSLAVAGLNPEAFQSRSCRLRACLPQLLE